MITTTEIPIITAAIAHYKLNSVSSEDIDFKIYRENGMLRAIPLVSEQERLATGLPKELSFVYSNQCIVTANDMEEDSLNAIKQIILEMQVQELL